MRLVLLGLPLGNIEDISLRAIKALDGARFVICEDTRVFNKLWMKLNSLGYINHKYEGKLSVINDFNEKDKSLELLAQIQEFGEAILVSDAGMPTISDPGFRLIQGVVDMGGTVTSVPGPTALTTAVAVSGLSADRVLFLGFLPQKQSKRIALWQDIARFSTGMTVAIYESPLRVEKTLREVDEYLGKKLKTIVLARELTKEHEEIVRGSIDDVLKANTKGESVILVRLESADD